MKTSLFLVLGTLAGIQTQIAFAQGADQPIFTQERCRDDDYVPPELVKGRNDWALQCGHLSKKLYKKYMLDIDDNDQVVPIPVGQQLYAVFTRPILDASGKIASTQVWRAPTDVTAACDLPSVPVGEAVFTPTHACGGIGCYAPEQRIAFRDGYEKIFKAENEKKSGVVAVGKNSTRDLFNFISLPVEKYITDSAPILQKMRTIFMSSGVQLKVTTNHPMLLASGEMVTAENLKTGDSMLESSGKEVIVDRIVEKSETIKTYNLQPTSKNLKENIIIAEGVLIGSLRYQNEYQKYVNSSLLRSTFSK